MKEERIEELKKELLELTKDCNFPEGKKDNFRWIYKQPLSSFSKCPHVYRVIGIIEKLRILSNDCIEVKF
jgi:hypothetical protein